MAILSVPFADYCNITFPAADFPAVEREVLEPCFAAGASSVSDTLLRLGDGGTVNHSIKYGVGCLGISGAALAALRAAGLFRDYLAAVAGFPSHRVTLLHATLDRREDGPAAVHRIFRRGRRGVIRLTSKAIPASQVKRITGVACADGRLTGTVYLGKRKRDVSAKVYDKREQLLAAAVERHGNSAEVIALNDPGPLTRYEIQFGRHVGVTLADVDDPTRVFWHHCGGLLRRPPGIEPWVAHGEGFVLPKRSDITYVQQLNLLLENSADIRRAVTLADKISATTGRQWLASKLKRYQLPGSGLAATKGSAAA